MKPMLKVADSELVRQRFKRWCKDRRWLVAAGVLEPRKEDK